MAVEQVSAVADRAILGIGVHGKMLDVFRFSFWNDEQVASAGGNGDELIGSGINPLFLQAPVELQQKVGITPKPKPKVVSTLMIEKVKRCLSMQ